MALITEEDQDFNSMSASFVEALYADYLRDPNSVSHDWQRFFAQIAPHEWPQPQLGPSFPTFSMFNPPDAHPAGANGNAAAANGTAYANGRPGTKPALDMAVLQDRVDQLVRAFRVRGHMVSALDPLGLPRPQQPELDPEYCKPMAFPVVIVPTKLDWTSP